MKILSIKLRNINSLRGETTLDFTLPPLKDAGLFAIIGATGSGKSTLLDCITLALFNEVPRLKNISADAIRKGGLIITRHETDCYAELKYSCKDGIFTSRWSVRRKRGSLNYDNPKMSVCDEYGKPLADKNREVIKFNEEKIGLSYEQFVKSIILCQGEFAKFLKSDKNDRAKLLEEITRTSDFRKLGERAFKRYRKLFQELGYRINYFKQIEEKLLDEDSLKAFHVQLRQLQQLHKTTGDEIGLLGKKIELRNQLNQLKQQVDQRKTVVEKLEIEWNEFIERNGQIINRYRELLPYKDRILEIFRLRKNSDDLAIQLQKLNCDFRKTKESISDALTLVSTRVKEEASELDYAVLIEEFRDKVDGMMSEKHQSDVQVIQILQRLISSFDLSYLKEEKLLFREDGNNEVLCFKLKDRLEKANTKHHANLVSETVTENDLEDKKLKLEVKISTLEGLRSTAELLEAGRQKIMHSREKREIDSRALSALRQSETKKIGELSILQAKFYEAQKARIEMASVKKLDEFRNKLVEGEDCPLCGSKHHPYVHAYAKELGQVENDFVDAEKALEKGRTVLQEVQLQVAAQTKSNEMHEKQLRELELNEKGYLEKIKTGELQLGAKGLDTLSGLSELLAKWRASLERIKFSTQFVTVRPVFKQVMQELADYGAMKSRSVELSKKIKEIYSGSDIKADCQNWRSKVDQLISSRTLIVQSIDTAEKQVAKNQSVTHQLELEIIPSLIAKGYADVETVKSHMIEESVYHDLTEKQNKIRTDLSTSRSLLDEDKVKLGKESEKVDPAFDLEWADEKIHKLKSELVAVEKDIDDVKVAIRTDQQFRDELKKGDEEMLQTKSKMRPWELLNGLIGDATGNKFNEFAQKLTLQHLLRYANNRLVKLHSRYELSMPEEDEDDDLVVLDTHMGSERRSVKTLSGGETFVISLALALGLSDLASRDIRIDSLFVDEGFGTLDADTLEQSISTLEQLQAESNKMVGIISHVESLKERIYTQVRLDKQSSGYSSLSIFPEGQGNTE